MLLAHTRRTRRTIWLALVLGVLTATGCTTPMETAAGTRCRHQVDEQRLEVAVINGRRFISEVHDPDRFVLWDECMEHLGFMCVTGGAGAPGRHYCALDAGHRLLNDGITNPYRP